MYGWPVAGTRQHVAMDVLLLPFRWIYRGLVWFANSPKTLIVSYLLMIVVAGILYSHAEHRAPPTRVWWAVVTASTGYGDISPTTLAGRFLAALLISTMVLLVIPLITAHFASRLIVDDDAFEHDEQEELKADVRRLRALAGGDGGPAGDRAARAGAPPAAARTGQRGPALGAVRAAPPPTGAVSAGPAHGQRAGQRSPSGGTVSEIRYASTAFVTQAVCGYAVCPSPSQVSTRPTPSIEASAAVCSYGVAGSPVVPTTTIGGAPAALPVGYGSRPPGHCTQPSIPTARAGPKSGYFARHCDWSWRICGRDGFSVSSAQFTAMFASNRLE